MTKVPADRRGPLFWTLVLGIWSFYACFYHSRDWNTATRVLLTHALAFRADVEITPYFFRGLETDPHTRDLAEAADGRLYCEKAPGTSFFGVLPCWIAKITHLAPPQPLSSRAAPYWPIDYWITLGTCGIFGAATTGLLYNWLCRLGMGQMSAMAAALAYGLATPALPYATLFYGHVPAGFALLGCVYLLEELKTTWNTTFGAGLVAGCAVAMEYTTVVYVFMALLLMVFYQPRRLPIFIFGGLPVAIALGWYHFLITGDPFKPAYSMVTNPLFEFHRDKVIPLTYPKFLVAREFIVSPTRGLLWYAPVVLGAIPGLWCMYQHGARKLALLIFWGTMCFFMLHCGFPNWHGGLGTGPRFLVPMLPLLMFSVGIWLGTAVRGRWRMVAGVAKFTWALIAVISAMWLLLCNVAGARFHHEMHLPWTSILEIVSRNRQEPHAADALLRWLGLDFPNGLIGYFLLLGAMIVFASFCLFRAARLDSRKW